MIQWMNDKLQSSGVHRKNSNWLKKNFLSFSLANSIATFPYYSMQVMDASSIIVYYF
jgi:hypothetical protein